MWISSKTSEAGRLSRSGKRSTSAGGCKVLALEDRDKHIVICQSEIHYITAKKKGRILGLVCDVKSLLIGKEG